MCNKTNHFREHQRTYRALLWTRLPLTLCFLFGLSSLGLSCVQVSSTEEETFFDDFEFPEVEESQNSAGTSSFTKPDYFPTYSSIFSNASRSSEGEQFILSSRGRKYSRSNVAGTINWLYEGEPLVHDMHVSYAGQSYPEIIYDYLVLVNFKPVKFALVEVHHPEGYPTLEEAKALEEFVYTSPVTLVNGRPVNFSIIIPPESFGEVGAHDIRIVPLRRYTPDPDRLAHKKGRGFVDGRMLTVYYGGYEIVGNTTVQLPGWQGPVNAELMDFLFFTRGSFARAARTIDLLPSDQDQEFRLRGPDGEFLSLGQAFSSAEKTAYFMILSSGYFLGSYSNDVKYVVFNNLDVLENPFGLGQIPNAPNEIRQGVQLDASFHPLEVELNEGLNAIRVGRFHSPYARPLPGHGDEIIHHFFSPTLFYEYLEDSL